MLPRQKQVSDLVHRGLGERRRYALAFDVPNVCVGRHRFEQCLKYVGRASNDAILFEPGFPVPGFPGKERERAGLVDSAQRQQARQTVGVFAHDEARRSVERVLKAVPDLPKVENVVVSERCLPEQPALFEVVANPNTPHRSYLLSATCSELPHPRKNAWLNSRTTCGL